MLVPTLPATTISAIGGLIVTKGGVDLIGTMDRSDDSLLHYLGLSIALLATSTSLPPLSQSSPPPPPYPCALTFSMGSCVGKSRHGSSSPTML